MSSVEMVLVFGILTLFLEPEACRLFLGYLCPTMVQSSSCLELPPTHTPLQVSYPQEPLA